MDAGSYVAAFLAGVVALVWLGRAPGRRSRPLRRPAGTTAWLVAASGPVGAVALVVRVLTEESLPGLLRSFFATWDVPALVGAALVTAALPPLAAAALPGAEGVRLLGGWVLAAVTLSIFLTGVLSMFGVVVLLQAALLVAVVRARGLATAPPAGRGTARAAGRPAASPGAARTRS
jgi:hypothetical protein